MEGICPLTEVFDISTEDYTDRWNDATVGSSPDMVDKMKTLVQEWQDIFDDTIDDDLAKVTKLNFENSFIE